MIQVRNLDIGASALLVVLGIYIAWQGISYGYVDADTPGAGFFPLWIGLGLALSAGINLVASIRRTGMLATIETSEMIRVLLCSAAMAVFVWLAGMIGMMVSAFVLMLAIGVIFGRRTLGFYAVLAVVSIGMTAVLYFIFGILLAVPLL
jgi:hypothetical protein